MKLPILRGEIKAKLCLSWGSNLSLFLSIDIVDNKSKYSTHTHDMNKYEKTLAQSAKVITEMGTLSVKY